MRTTTTVFREIKLYGKKKFKCDCGKRVRRRKKFYQTINPWNQKTPSQITNELCIEIKQWQEEPEVCTHLNHGE